MSEAGKDTETNAVQTSEEEESHPVLIPGMDIFNRESTYFPKSCRELYPDSADSRGQPITWLTSSDPRTISLVAPSTIESGVQVYNNYGPKPNEELLLGYGFVLSPNPDDVLPLRLGGLGSNVSESKKARLTSKGLDAGKRWIIKRDGEIPRDLMEVLRIVMGDEQSHQHGHDHEHDDDDDEEEEEHGHWEQEMELELDVLGALGQMLDDKLAKLENVDTSIEAREDVRTMCGVYRQGKLNQFEAYMVLMK